MKEKIKDYVMAIVGTTMTALAFGLLILPKGILAGGVTGCARLLSAWCALPVSGIVLVINTGLFIAGYLCMGRAFVMRSVVSTFYFPLALELAQKLTQPEISSTPAAAAVVNGIDALLTLLQVIHASAVQIIGALPLVAMCGVTMNFLIVQCRAKHFPRTEPKKV